MISNILLGLGVRDFLSLKRRQGRERDRKFDVHCKQGRERDREPTGTLLRKYELLLSIWKGSKFKLSNLD